MTEPIAPTPGLDHLVAAIADTKLEIETSTGLGAREGASQYRPTAPTTPHVMQVDRWGARRGAEIVEEWKAAEAGEHVPTVVADAHAALFDIEPKLAEQPADAARAAWFKQLMETPEYEALRQKTALDTGLSALAAKNICDEWVTYVAEHGNASPDSAGNESIGDTLNRMKSCSKAVGEAGETVQTARDAAAGLGMGANGQGIDPKALAELYTRIRGDDFLKQLMRMAGRMRTLCQTLQRTKTQHGRDDTVGVELAGDVARLVPSELAQLACGIPELELLALDRVARKQAMCRKYRAIEPLGRGPIVVVVDESGSMDGEPIIAAKAIALALAWLARQQRRWIALVGFSGGTEGTRVAFPPGEMDQEILLEWLTHFYGGGTTLDVPLHEVPHVYWPEFMATGMKRGRTDVVLITDAQVNAPDEMIDRYVAWAKAEQVRTYGIVIGETEPGDIERVATRHWCVSDLSMDSDAVAGVLSI